MATQRLTKNLTTPSKIASALDWRKATASLLSLQVDTPADKFQLTLSLHPDKHEEPVQLDPIDLEFHQEDNKRVLDDSISSQLSDICRQNKSCGLVVDWPLQEEGRMGASCGRVLHTLDALNESSDSVLGNNRKFCLWDGRHTAPEETDAWGRSAKYSQLCTTKSRHVASEEQYEQQNQVAVDVWNDFCRAHWPELYCAAEEEQETPRQEHPNEWVPPPPEQLEFNADWLDSFEKKGCYLQAAAL